MRTQPLAWHWGERLGIIIGFVAAIDLAVMTLITIVDVGGRYVFNAPLVGADELTTFALGIMVFGSLPLIVARNGLIQVEIAPHLVPAIVARGFDVLARGISSAILLLFAWRLFEKAQVLASYGDATMFLRISTAPLAYTMAAMCLVSGLLMLALTFSQPKVVKVDAKFGGSAR